MAKKKHWSYNAGERGRNWVRAYEDSRDGKLYLEWRSPAIDPDTGAPLLVMNRRGEQIPKRVRKAVVLTDCTREEAKARADAAAARLAEIEEHSSALTVRSLLNRYVKEETPTKGESKRAHDKRARRVFLKFFDSQPEPERRSNRHPSSLDRIDWNRFIQQRSEGLIPGWERPVGARMVAYDLKFMIAALTWASGVQEGDGFLLDRNPWGAEQRRAQRLVLPKTMNPRRPAMTDAIREQLIQHSPHWQFPLALVLARYTISRNSSVRHLRWSDVSLVPGQEQVVWREEFDKSGHELVVPLLPEAVEALKAAPRGIGEAWVFPSPTDPAEPTGRHTFQIWLRRAKDRLLKSIEDEHERAWMKEQLRGLGYHAEKRAGVRDPWFRSLDPKMKEALARTNHQTLVAVYDDVALDEMRNALLSRRIGG